jgi:hypothetical protein
LAALDVVAVGLESEGIEYLRFNGSMKAVDKTSVRKAFQAQEPGTPKVLLLTIGTGGAWLNFPVANHVIILIPEWSPATEEQAIARAYREGQIHTVYFIYLIAKLSMDIRVAEKQEVKEAKAFGLLDLYTVDPHSLSAVDLRLCTEVKAKILEMKEWTKADYCEQVSEPFAYQDMQRILIVYS